MRFGRYRTDREVRNTFLDVQIGERLRFHRCKGWTITEKVSPNKISIMVANDDQVHALADFRDESDASNFVSHCLKELREND